MAWKAFVTIAICFVVLAAPAAARWSVGEEREVDEGYYFTLVDQQYGWRIWRISVRSGDYCSAVKSASGRPHPEPLGFLDRFFDGTPFVDIRIAGARRGYNWRTTWLGDVRIKHRGIGDRFWSPTIRGNSFVPHQYGEGRFEILMESWEHPELALGRIEERAIFDLVGYDWAISRLEECQG